MGDNTQEKIGNVILDYTYYSGEDLYSEGEAEDALLDIVKKHPESEFDKIIQQSCSWSTMYHLSHIRENALSWFTMENDYNVLEVGAGCGAVTGELARHAESVTCIELSKKRSLINAERHKDFDNIKIMVGNFEEIEPNLDEKYDLITLCGVLEYSTAYLSGDHKHHKMIEILKKHLKPGGKIFIAIENRLGLKYFAGCKEDHTGEYFGGIMGYRPEDSVRTFSKNQLETLLDECGMVGKFYYPYPDYKLPHTIYSDDFLPGIGELTTNDRNFDADRMVLFDEAKAFDSMIEAGLFPMYSNSFIVIATVKGEQPYDEGERVPIYAKYSDERLDRLRVATEIMKNYDGGKAVFKWAVSTRANKHIKRISDNYELLQDIYKDTVFTPNRSVYIEGQESTPLLAGVPSRARDRVKLDFLDGISLDAYLDELDQEGRFEDMDRVITMYVNAINDPAKVEDFESSPIYESVFGKREYKKAYKASNYSNFDMIFSNIVLDKDKKENGPWNVLDYEWLFDFKIPTAFIIYRALYYYFSSRPNSAYARYLLEKGKDVYAQYGIDIGERMLFDEMEHSFQVYIIGGVASLEVMRVMMPSASISIDKIVSMGSYMRNLDTPKIYYSRGRVFTPEQRINLIAKVNNGLVSIRIPVEHYLNTIRIDPTEYPCVMHLESARIVMPDGKRMEVEEIITNAYAMTERTYIYNTDDAQLIIENIPQEAKALEVNYLISMFEPAFYNDVLSICQEKEEKIKENERRLSYRIKRKLGIVKVDSDMPEGFRKTSIKKL